MDLAILPQRKRSVSWADNSDFYDANQSWIDVPDPEADGSEHEVLEWELDPGDAVLFDYKTVHGARGNDAPTRRRALSLRFVGDDAHYVARPHDVSPPFPELGLKLNMNDSLPQEWFPTVWQRG